MSDRWHLTKNLANCVSVVLTQCLTEIRHAAHSARTETERETQGVVVHRSARTRAIQQAQQARKAERGQRYQIIMTLRNQGRRAAEIAAKLGMGERTVRHWLSAQGIPYSRERRPRPRLIDPYRNYLNERWQQGCHQGSQLEKEVRARGYTGSQRGIYRYLETLESSAEKSVSRRSVPALTPVGASMPFNPPLMLSVQQATWLFFRKRADLKEEEKVQLNILLQESTRAKTAYHLVETFLSMMRERTGEQLDA